MAAPDDILDAIAALIATALYPDGTGQPSAVGVLVRVYPGWPVRTKLDDDLRLGAVHVSVFFDAHEQSKSVHLRDWRELCRADNLLDMEIEDNVVTLSGTPALPQNVGLVVADGDEEASYVYAVQDGDTPTSVATGLATLIDGADNTGPVITFPDTVRLRGSIGIWGTLYRELRWSSQRIMVNVWAPNPTLRRAVSNAIDQALSMRTRVNLADGAVGTIDYHGQTTLDELEEARLYRRILFYDVQYPTIETEDAPEIILIEANHAGSQFPEPDTTITTILGGA